MRTDKAPKSMAARRRKFQHQLEMLQRRERQNERARWHSRPAPTAEQRMRRESQEIAARKRIHMDRKQDLAAFRQRARANGYELMGKAMAALEQSKVRTAA